MKYLIYALMLTSAIAAAEEIRSSDQELDRCLQNVKARQSGYFIKVEKLKFQGKGVFELEIAEPNKGEWEFLCEAKTGQVIEQEGEAQHANDPAFKKNARVTEQEAAKIALKAVPGKIKEVEYELESNGGSSYEFDIISDKGIETKVEVDAANGKIIETAYEDWEIGEEPEEKR